MKRRFVAMILAMCLCLLTAECALAAKMPSDEFFRRGKDALTRLAEGDLDGALKRLSFQFDEGSGLSEDGFQLFVADSFTMLRKEFVQSKVAVCWFDGALWRLGIPLVEPMSDDVEALVLVSRDLESFCGYEASTWKGLTDAAAWAQQAVWNEEHLPGTPVLMADD